LGWEGLSADCLRIDAAGVPSPFTTVRRDAMDVTTQQFKRCDVVKASGRVDHATAPQLEAAFNEILEAGRFTIVFDMSDVDFISSVGLRALINARKRCRRYNRGDLVLASAPPNVDQSLELAGFHTLFAVYETTLEAVGSF
jgi:anti-sigma B factor antagonist